MTDSLRGDVAQLAAGRELDALVLTRVLGWLAAPTDGQNYGLNAAGQITALLHPSTDIAAAWEVVDEMTRDGFRVVVDADANGADVMVERDGAFFNDRAPAAPLAICRSAIAAVYPAVNPAHSGNLPASEPQPPE